ncbi:hypothetical protein DTO271D3_6256 [Paecilomyces variotii]|nr:hypothetical protein DTO271D3_6256 [Paecilomyces variotii]
MLYADAEKKFDLLSILSKLLNELRKLVLAMWFGTCSRRVTRSGCTIPDSVSSHMPRLHVSPQLRYKLVLVEQCGNERGCASRQCHSGGTYLKTGLGNTTDRSVGLSRDYLHLLMARYMEQESKLAGGGGFPVKVLVKRGDFAE